MTPKLIIAPPASGKTAECIDRILAVQKEQPLTRVWVVVPSHQKAAYFKKRLAEAGGGISVRVGAFRTFYQEILEGSGVFTPVITPALSHRLIQETVREAYESGVLTHFAAIREKSGFLSVLRDAFAELRSGMVQPEAFLEITHDAPPGKHELAILYERFLARLNAVGWVDAEGQAWQAIKALEAGSTSFSYPRLVIADGFTSFTAAQRNFLKHLARQSSEMLITLTGESTSTRQVDTRSQVVLKELQSAFPVAILEKQDPPHLPTEILHIQQHIFEPRSVDLLNAQNPFMIETRSQSEEAREALRWIKRLHVREGVPLDACVLYTANLETYRPLLRSAAEEFGINIHFSQPEPLSESPTILALLSFLRLPLEGYPTRSLLNTLHSPYFSFGFEAEDLKDLETCSQQAIIVGGRHQWEEAWQILQKTQSNVSEDLDEERSRKNRLVGINLSKLRESLDSFWLLFSAIESLRTQTEWVEWLEALLKALGFYENVSNDHDREACGSLGDALSALVLSESVVGSKVVDYSQFLADLEGTLVGSHVEDAKESRSNSVLVSKMVQARGVRYDAVVLLGLSEGLFPVVENPDPILDEQMRVVLGLEPRLGRHQASTFYQAFTRADTHLLLTRPYLTEEGEKWEPSIYWEATRKLFTEKTVIKISPNEARPQSEAASTQELLFWAVQQHDPQYLQGEELINRWHHLQQASVILDSRRARFAHGDFEGNLSRNSDQLEIKYSSNYVWSASKLEAYKKCPFWFLVAKTLKLETNEPPELGLDIAQRGSLYHKLMELVYRKAVETGVSPLELLDGVAEEVFATAPKVFEFRPSPLWEVEKAELLKNLRKNVEELEQTSTGWEPVGFEHKFGIGGTPPLVLNIDGRQVKIHGVIDRLDRKSDGSLRVIDYKTGSSNLAQKDLQNGIRLQLPIYALAAQEALQQGEVTEGFYWVINNAKRSSIQLSSFEYEKLKGPEAAYQAAREHVLDVMEGVNAGEFSPESPKGGCPTYCPAKIWCWRFEAGRNYD